MKQAEFNELALETFKVVLSPLGFSNEGSHFAAFYRKATDEVYHFIIPAMGTRGAWYDIRVFPHSPHICPLFQRQFPDNLGIPTDRYSLLSAEGVGLTQKQFNCKYADNFRRGFASEVKTLLLEAALPYLERFRTVSELIPVVRRPSFLGFAYYYLGEKDKAVAVLRKEKERLERLGPDSSHPDVIFMRESIDSLLRAH